MKRRGTRKKSSAGSLKVESKRTGLVHQITDLDGLDQFAEAILSKFVTDNQLLLAQSLKFLEFIQGQTLSGEHLVANESVLSYRICFNGLDPLSIEGSLASGGRFNIGGAQVHQEFPYEMAACLYVADSVECAKTETGPHRNPEIYQLSTIAPVELWDVRSMLLTMDNGEELIQLIEKHPFNMVYNYQKFPIPSQILGATLRRIGGDGIIYPSTKHKGGSVYSFFIKDRADATTKLKAVRLDGEQMNLPLK